MPHFSSPILKGTALFQTVVAVHKRLFAEPDPLLQSSILLQAAAAIVDRSDSATKRQAALDYPGVRRARDYIATHVSESIELAQLASIAGLSQFHLLRAFRRQFGLPPHAYHIQLRLEKAKDLLASGSPPVNVALATGFSDQAHLTRVFRRFCGVPPGRYGHQKARIFKTCPS